MYKIYIYYIENCFYSASALKLLENVNHKKILVPYDKKYLYKSKLIDTFPQIYLKKDDSVGSLLIGGYDDLVFIINTLKKHKDLDKIKKIFNKKYKNKWANKAILRMIELFVK